MLKYFLSKIYLKNFQKSFLFLYKIGIVPPPRFVVWDSTRRCNLNCEHCGAKKEKYSSELTTQQIKKLIKNLANHKVEYFVVTGGEPLLRDDLFEVFSFAKKQGLKTGIATNGFLINKKNSKIIAKLFDSVQISLDGPKEAHNRIRKNKKSFQKAVNAISLLRKNNCKQITVSSVVTPFNLKNLEELLEINKNLNIDIWKIVTVMPIGNVLENDFLYLSKDEFLKFLNFVKKNKKEIKIEVGENLGYLGRHEKELREKPFFCPAGFLACCVGVNGNIRGCPEQPDIPYFIEGNILEKDFFEIWGNGFKKYRNKVILQNENCRKCKFKNDCNGGCWVMKLENINCSVKRYCL